VRDVVAQVLDEVGIWVVGHDDLGGTAQCTYKAREAPTRAKLENGLALDELASTFFEIR
jgi:hypothetical protein